MNASEVARPTDLREARDLMAAGRRTLVRGAATAQAWGAPVGPVDLVIDTTGLDALVVYNPADMTVSVGAGMSFAALHEHLVGQRVALDAARIPHGATVGGLLATGDAGPARHLYGTLRDLVLGVTVVLADGTVARSGGHVVKNVAGYDLGKLLSGSLGTLGLITEVVLRLHPVPVSTGTLAVEADPAAAFDLATSLLRSPIEPAAIDWHAGRLLVRLEGTPSSVTKRLDAAAGSAPNAVTLTGDDEASAWQGISACVLGSDGDTVLRAGTVPARFPALVRALDQVAGDNDVSYELTSSLGVGVHTVRLHGGTPHGHAAVLRSWRSKVSADGGSVTLHRRIDGLDDLAPSWGEPPSSVGVLRALKDRLDGHHRLAPGRFAPWIEDS